MAGSMTICWKELADHLGSKRYIVLFALIVLLSTMSAYQGTQYMRTNTQTGFLNIFSGTQYGFSFISLMVFFGPIIGLALGFDAINKERTSGSLSTLLSQPIYRDSIINGKFIAGTMALSLLAASTVAIMCSVAIFSLGFGPTLTDVSRIVFFTLLTVLYLAFWLGLGLLFSTVTKKTSTSILMSISTWLFFSIVVTIMAALVANTLVPISIQPGQFNPGQPGQPGQTQEYMELLQKRSSIQISIQRISPANLYSEASSSILGVVGGTSLGFLGVTGGGERFQQLGLTQGILSTWPQIVAIAVGLIICFAASYILFLRLEIRPGG